MRHRSWLQCVPALVCLLAGDRHARGRCDAELHALFDDAWERSLREDPLSRPTLGDQRYDARWPDYSAARSRSRRDAGPCRDRCESTRSRAAELPPADQLNRDLFRPTVRDARGGATTTARSTSARGSRTACSSLDQLTRAAAVRDRAGLRELAARLKTLRPASSTSRSRCCATASRSASCSRASSWSACRRRIETQIVDEPDAEPVLRDPS